MESKENKENERTDKPKHIVTVKLQEPISINNVTDLNQPLKVIIEDKSKGIFKVLKPDEWTSISALFISVITIWLSCNQFSNQQTMTINHDKLSVKPLLQPDFEYTSDNPWIGIGVVNKGLGPAIISSVDKFYDSLYFFNWGDLYENLKGDSTVYWKQNISHWNNLDSNQVISPDEMIKLWSTDSSTENDLVKCKTFLSKINIFIKYKDIYNDTFSLHLKLPL